MSRTMVGVGFGTFDTTFPTAPSLAAPTGLAAGTPTSSTVGLTWDTHPSAASIASFRAYYTTDGSDPTTASTFQTVAATGSATAGSLTGLPASRMLTVRIVAVHTDGVTLSSRSAPVEAVTAADTSGSQPGGAQPLVTIDPQASLQTMQGFAGIAHDGTYPDAPAAQRADRETYVDRLAELVVTEAGMHAVRVNMRSGLWNDADYFQIWYDDPDGAGNKTNHDQWDYAPLTTGTFQPGFIDYQYRMIQEMLPWYTGQPPFIHLGLTDYPGQANNDLTRPNTFEMKDRPDLLADLYVAAFQHIEATYGVDLIPNAVELLNEPDHNQAGPWTTAQVAAAIKSVGDALAAAGYTPEFITSSVSNNNAALTYFDAAWDYDPAADSSFPNRAYIGYISYHMYFTSSLGQPLLDIVASANAKGLGVMMTEHNPLTPSAAWTHLSVGQCALLVQGGTLSGIYSLNVGGTVAAASDDPAAYVQVTDLGQRFHHLFSALVRGSVRKTLTRANGAHDTMAWLRPDGKWSVLLKSISAQTLYVAGLPAGTYDITYGNEITDTWKQDGGQVVIGEGDALSFTTAAGSQVYYTVVEV